MKIGENKLENNTESPNEPQSTETLLRMAPSWHHPCPFLTGGGGIRSDTNGGATGDCYRASVLRNDSRARVQTSEPQRLLNFLLGQATRGGVIGA